jgi:hypothetical protein
MKDGMTGSSLRSLASLRNVSAAIFAFGLALTPSSARAYTIANAFAYGCHEDITSRALRAIRLEQPVTAAPLSANDDENALIDDVQFTPDGDMKDLGAISLLIGVRDNDLKGRGSSDLSQLAEVHGNPDGQREHCLRGPNQKEPGGTKAALADCVAFIRERVQQAVASLDANGKPDLANRTSLTVHLSIRGQVDASLPTYYVRMGQAIHAVEDSFTHTYRTADEMQITVILDWLDAVNNTLDESHDGPAHAGQLDRCDDPDDLRTKRHQLAIEASTAMLRATLDPKLTPALKLAAVDTVIQTYMGYSDGCTFSNNWCEAPERQYKDANGCGCVIGTIHGGTGALLSGAVFTLFALGRRSRRTRRSRTRSVAAITGALGISLATLLTPAMARAEAPAPHASAAPPDAAPDSTNPHEPPPPKVTPVKESLPEDPSKIAFGGYMGLSGSIEKAALAGTAALRMRVSNHWTFGLDGEWNPWLALNGTTVRRGVINVYGTAILRFPLAYENFNLRSTVNLGVSSLLSSFYGAPSGSTGLYFGVSPLGIEWKLSKVFYVIINPINVALPAPQLKGVPLLYPQYRTSVGLEFYF